jgi:hypothetical protein
LSKVKAPRPYLLLFDVFFLSGEKNEQGGLSQTGEREREREREGKKTNALEDGPHLVELARDESQVRREPHPERRGG